MKSPYLSLFAAGLLTSCTAEHIINTVPLVTTVQIQNIQDTSVIVEGYIENDAGSTITEAGIVLSTTSQQPTIEDIKAFVVQGEGEYAVTANNLQPVTTYYCRAYATNANGPGYGETYTFTTVPTACTHGQQNFVTAGAQDLNITGVQQQTNVSGYYIYGNVAYFTAPVNNTVITLQFFEPTGVPPATGVYTTTNQYTSMDGPEKRDIKVYVSTNGQQNAGNLATNGQLVYVENNNGTITFTFCQLQLNGGTVLDGTFTYDN